LGVLAGAKNLTRQTVLLKKVFLSKLDFSMADKHKTPHHGLSITSNCLSPPLPLPLMLVEYFSGV
jgi:hypothetical protein